MSETIAAVTTKDDILTDAKGRKLRLRVLNVLEQVRLLRAIGPDQAANQPYVNMVQAAASVAEIDGVPCPMPYNERTIDGAISRLGDEGFAAILVNIQKQIKDLEEAAERAQEQGEAASSDPLEKSAS